MKQPNTELNTTDWTGGIVLVLQRMIPIGLVVILSIYLVYGIVKAAKPGEMTRYDFDTLADVPVSEDGRVKPLDTVARNALLMVSGKQSLSGEMLLEGEGDSSKPALIWLAELASGRPESLERKVIRIDDPGIVGLMGKAVEDGKYFSLSDLTKAPAQGKPQAYEEIDRLAREAQNVRDDQRTRFQDHVIGLRRKLSVMIEIQAMARPYVIPPVATGQDWAPIVENARGAFSKAAAEREPAQTWIKLLNALRADNPELFNATLQEHLTLVAEHAPKERNKAAFEVGFNRYKPFTNGIVLYILAGLLGLVSLLLRPIVSEGWYRSIWRSGMGVLVLGFVLHTAALIVRIWLQGRPPVTNLYSSAIFIGWGVVGGSIILEKVTKLGVASLAASSCGVATLIVAHNLAKDGDTMGVMQAVLDSNFWLGTHVITITLGYSATFLAAFLAMLYILFGMTTRLLDRQSSRAIAGMVYGVICFALLFSFVGTVLGGIWADQSWGRFWGWDPKENGAILIVLMNAIILHARWGHMIKERGLMVLTVSGSIITTWSWFGTNLLGVGLHSYGFMDGAMAVLMVVAANHLMVMSVALLLPTKYWCSFYKGKGDPILSRGQQVALGAGLLLVGSTTLAGMLYLTFYGSLNLYAWLLTAPLLFMLAGGMGLLAEGLLRLGEDTKAKRNPGLAAT